MKKIFYNFTGEPSICLRAAKARHRCSEDTTLRAWREWPPPWRLKDAAAPSTATTEVQLPLTGEISENAVETYHKTY